MTIRYIDNQGSLQTDTTVTKIEPIQNGTNFLLSRPTTNLIIPIRNLVEITTP